VNAADVHDFLEGLAATTPALPEAACRRHREVFDSTDPGPVAQAVEICGGCADLQPCRRWAQAQPPRTLLGVIAGKFYTYNMSKKKENNTS
jgi:hypothetical protein